MKSIYSCLVFFLLLGSCASTRDTSNTIFNNALIGQNEIAILHIIGTPTNISHTRDGGKVMVYEHLDKGTFLTPNKSNFSLKEGQGLTFTSNVNKATNDPHYTIYPTNISCLRLYINNRGKCVRVENSLPHDQYEYYHQRFKHFENRN